MTEIKFREALTNQWDEFIGFHYWGFIDGIFIIPKYSGNSGYSYQYTGLKDINGKKICEGDILKCEVEFNLYKSFFIGEVLFEKSGFSCRGKVEKNTDGYLRMYHLHELFNIEVIGNIHENPELLDR